MSYLLRKRSILIAGFIAFAVTASLGLTFFRPGTVSRSEKPLLAQASSAPLVEASDPQVLAAESSTVQFAFPSDLNMLANSSFEASGLGSMPSGWTPILASSQANSFVSNESVRSGNLSLKFYDSAGSPTHLIPLGLSQPSVQTVNGRSYVFSVNVRTIGLIGNPILRIGFIGTVPSNDPNYGGSGFTNYAADKYRDFSLKGTGSWRNFSFSYTGAALGKYPFIQITNYAGGGIFVDDASMYEVSWQQKLTAGNLLGDFQNSGLSLIDLSQNAMHQSITRIGDGSVTVDASGNIYPTSGLGITGAIGTSGNRFSGGYFSLLDSSGDLNVDGTSTLQGVTLTNATMSGTLSVTGDSTFGAGSFTSLTNTGLSSLQNVTLSGDLTVNGFTTFGNTNFTFNPGFTAGSVIFEGSLAMAQNNSKFFWDNTNYRLGIGTSSPSYSIDTTGTINGALQDKNGQVVNVKAYGAKGDGVTDDYTAIKNAITAASGGSKTLFIPAGTYNVSQKLVVTDHMTVECDSGTILKATAAMDYVLGMPLASNPVQNFTIRRCIVDGNNLATNAIYLKNISYVQGLTSVWGRNAVADGVFLQDCQGGSFVDVRASANGAAGIRLVGSNGSRFYGLNSYSNTGDGIQVDSSVTASGGVQLIGIRSEANGGHGIDQNSSTGVSHYESGWLELNAGDGVRVNSGNVRITGLRISGVGTGSNWAINISGATLRGLDIRANYLSASSGSSDYAAVKTHDNVTYSSLSPNYSTTGVMLDNSGLDATTAEALGIYRNGIIVNSSVSLQALGQVYMGGIGTGSGAARDVFMDPVTRIFTVGRISDTIGDSSIFIVRSRLNVNTFKVDPGGNGSAAVIGTFSVTRGVNLASGTGGLTVGTLAGGITPPTGGIITDGNVGIGTSSPGNRLDVANNSTSTASAMIRNTSTSAGIAGLGIQLNSTTLDGTSRFINFLDGNGNIIGKVQAGSTSSVNYATNGIDFAEWFTKEGNGSFTPGTVVSAGSAKQSVSVSTSAYDAKVLGIVSKSPGFTGGTEGADKVTVALVGQVPVNIDPASAPISSGDALTTSDLSGFAKKATEAGPTVAKALESWTPGSGVTQIMVYVNVSMSGNPTNYIATSPAQINSPAVPAGLTLDALEKQGAIVLSGNLTVLGQSEFERLVTFGAQLIANAEATFAKAVTFLSDVTIHGTLNAQNVSAGRIVSTDKDRAGYAIVGAGSSSVEVKFVSEYTNAPIVNLTPQGDSNTRFWVSNVTSKGFTISLGQPMAEAATFNWSAVAVTDPQTTTGGSASTPLPTEIPTSTPQATDTAQLSSPLPISESLTPATSSATVSD